MHTARRQDLIACEAWQKHISFRWLVRTAAVHPTVCH